MKFIHYLLITVLCFIITLIPLQLKKMNKSYSYTEINNEWQFYEQTFYDGSNKPPFPQATVVNLPIEFIDVTGDLSTYGTFIKQLSIPQEYIGEILALEIPYVYGAIRVYVDGELLKEVGTVGTDAASHDTNLQPVVIPVTFEESEATLAIQMSSFEHIRGGFSTGLTLGESDYLHNKFLIERLIIAFFAGIIFITGTLALLIGLLSRDQKILLIFGLFSIGVALRSIFAVPFIYHELPVEISYLWGTRMEYITTNLVFLLYGLFVYLLFKELVFKPIIILGVALLSSLAIFTMFSQPAVFQHAFFNSSFFIVGFVIYTLYIIVRAVRSKMHLAKPLFIGIIFVFIGLIVDLISGIGILHLPSLSLFTIAMNVVLILFFIGQSYVTQLGEVKQLNSKLTHMNVTLDEKVKARTLQLSQANERLSDIATKDGLTGIYNRHKFNEILDYHFEHAKKHNYLLGLLIMDIDEFKKYNDYYGHVKGDELLKNLTQIIQNYLPDDVIFARYGGEEFIFVLPNYTLVETIQIAEKVHNVVRDQKMEHLGRTNGIITISIGGVELTAEQHITTPIQLVEIADTRLYISKNQGRDCVTFYHETPMNE